MVYKDKLITRPRGAFDAEVAFAEPVSNMNLYLRFIPAPHLETFLAEVNEFNAELIGHEFISALYSVSVEDIEATDQQIMYAKMCAYGFCSDPDRFSSSVELTIAEKGGLCFRTIMRFGAIDNVTSGIALAKNIFGITKELADSLSASKMAPTARIIRLAQIGVLNEESLALFLKHSDNFPKGSYGILENHELSPIRDAQLAELASDKNCFGLLKLSSDTELVIDAIRAHVELSGVLNGIRLNAAKAEFIIKAHIDGLDNSLISSMLIG